MRNVARLPESDRRELFRNTADKMGLNDAIVEKDFWVCFTLDYLFHRCPWKDAITFKGGTSLSKAFNLISRFSEDIDLILDWRVLGYGRDEPWGKALQHQAGCVQQRGQCTGGSFPCGAVWPHHSGRALLGTWL
ncbi:MAG: nucleotidyl transferase AbiEii/AbiGii toxin family protein [Oscillospiraceae bacterium]